MIDVSRLWVTEWIILGFFAYLILLARVFPLSSRQRLRVLAVGLVCAGLAVMLSQLRLSPILRVARDWLPAIYLLQGVLALRGVLPTADARRGTAADRQRPRAVSGHQPDGVSDARTEAAARVPRVDVPAGLSLVPISFGLFIWLGFRASADNFWAAILLAGYGCYGCSRGSKRAHPGASSARTR